MNIIITPRIEAIIETALADNEGKEWTMFGKTQYQDGNVHIIDIYVPHQESNASNTELTDEDQVKMLDDLLDKGEDPKQWNCWIHSHHRMQAFWSATDKQNMQDFDNGSIDWFAHIVVSTNGYRGAITQYRPFVFTNDDVPVVVGDHEETDKNKALLEELTELELRIEEIENELIGDIDQITNTLAERNRVTLPQYGKHNKQNHKRNTSYAQSLNLPPEYADDERFDYWGGDNWLDDGEDIGEVGNIFFTSR